MFTRDPAASFGIITDTSEALRTLSATEVQQGTRMQSLGLNYKRLPLIDSSAALSWRGSPYGLRDQVVRAVRNHPRLDVWLKRAFGKPLSREEN